MRNAFLVEGDSVVHVGHTRTAFRHALIGALVLIVTVGGIPATAWADATTGPSDSATTAAANEDATTPAATPTTSTTSSATTDPEPSSTASAEPSASASATASPTGNATLTPSSEPSVIGTGKPSAGTGISAAAIPAPPTNSSIVNVKVGGNRTGVSGVTGLAGVVLGLYTTTTATTPSYTCTSDADGDCNFTVPNTQQGGANRNARFYIKAISAPSGWRLNQTLRTGDGDGGNSQSTAYQFQTPQLQSGQTYTSTEDFMVGSGNSNRAASGGVWQLSRTNPTLPTSCGLDVALILDLSGSVGSR